MNIDSVQLNFNQDNLWILNACLALVMLGVALELKIEDFHLDHLEAKQYKSPENLYCSRYHINVKTLCQSSWLF